MKFRPSSSLTATLAAIGGALLCLIQTGHADPLVIPIKPAGLQQAIKAQKGRVVLVNFWATWCAPCVAELPGLAKLQKDNAKKGLTVILVSGDDPAEGASVKKTLKAKGQGNSYLVQSDLTDFFAGFDPKDKSTIALPRTYIFDRKGRRVAMVTNDHTAAQYQKMIKPYL